MNIWKWILDRAGWTVDISAARRQKCVICVAPHTSNLDFFMGLAAYRSKGWDANFLMKKFWFFFPLGLILRHFGGIPVDRSGRSASLTAQIAEDFREADYLNLAVTPEGTRSRTAEWHTGFLRIAVSAKVPVQLGVIDYSTRSVIIRDEFMPSGDITADMEFVRRYYSKWKTAARYPEKFECPTDGR